MIEWKVARDNEPVPFKNGVSLCSSVDPRREAAAWITAVSPLLTGVRGVVVLGLGGGFHIQELQQRFCELEILIVEPEPELITSATGRGILVQSKIQIVSHEEPLVAAEEPSVSQVLSRSYVVLKHAPSVRAGREFFDNWDRFLCGRDPVSFKYLASLRGLDMPLMPRFDEEKISLSVLDVHNGLSRSQVTPDGRLIWDALRELVK